MQIDSYVVHIVDDEEAARKSLAFLLTTMGFTVRVHASATDFLAVAPEIGRACLTGQGDVPIAVAAMKAGAVDFIEKPFEDEVLVDAIRHAASRLDRAEAADDDATLRARLDQLSERERQVLSAVVAGMPNKTIAYDLNISPRTVEVHRANVMAKMQARSLPDLVRMAITLATDSRANPVPSPAGIRHAPQRNRRGACRPSGRTGP